MKKSCRVESQGTHNGRHMGMNVIPDFFAVSYWELEIIDTIEQQKENLTNIVYFITFSVLKTS